MIYKRDITTTAEFQPTIVKIDDSGWYWINKPDQKWRRGNHTYDYPRDISSRGHPASPGIGLHMNYEFWIWVDYFTRTSDTHYWVRSSTRPDSTWGPAEDRWGEEVKNDRRCSALEMQLLNPNVGVYDDN